MNISEYFVQQVGENENVSALKNVSTLTFDTFSLSTLTPLCF
jgi:hypothetical protein